MDLVFVLGSQVMRYFLSPFSFLRKGVGESSGFGGSGGSGGSGGGGLSVGLDDFDDPLHNVNGPSDLFGQLVSAVLPIVGILFVGLFIYGGIQYITSAGDPGKVKQAQGILVNATIGLVIVVAAFAVKTLIANVLKVSI